MPAVSQGAHCMGYIGDVRCEKHGFFRFFFFWKTGFFPNKIGFFSLENRGFFFGKPGVSKENRGTRGQYLNIAGDLIAYAAHQAHQAYGEWACISLVPKTELINHYMNEYSFRRAGTSLYLDGTGLVELINRFNHD